MRSISSSRNRWNEVAGNQTVEGVGNCWTAFPYEQTGWLATNFISQTADFKFPNWPTYMDIFP